MRWKQHGTGIMLPAPSAYRLEDRLQIVPLLREHILVAERFLLVNTPENKTRGFQPFQPIGEYVGGDIFR